MIPQGRPIWSRFLAITLPFFRSGLRRRALLLLGLLVGLLLSVSGLNVVNSYVGRHFMTAVAERAPGRVLPLAVAYVGFFLVLTLVAVFYRFTEERLGLMWRRWLTEHLAGRYLAGDTPTRIATRKDVDNPDQRMTEDVRMFTATTLSLLLILLNSTISLFAFAGVLWSITPWLFVAVIVYAAVGSLCTLTLGRPLVRLNISQLKREADLRYQLVRVRERGEGLAADSGRAAERARVVSRLDAAVENLRRVIAVNRNLGFFAISYNYLAQVVPVLIVAPLYMRGDVEFGAVTQAVMAFAHVLGAFSLLVTEFGRLSAFAAVVARVGELNEALDEDEDEPAAAPADPEPYLPATAALSPAPPAR